jgi:predicted DNA-binding transcriptional regulator YafY
MPVNRNALIRYKAIDSCLRNRQRKWTLDKLIEKVSNALYEYEGMDKGISRRTIQADIQIMRSNKLGYNAPIIIVDKKYYTYEDPDYSITNIPLTEQDLGRMNEAVEVLKQFKGFSHFSALNQVVQKLEAHVYTAANRLQPVIDFEKNERLRGLEHLDGIYKSIVQAKALQVTYQSFTAREPNTFIFHTWWLKEFKNRWFAVGVKEKDGQVLNLALDRMIALSLVDKPNYIDNDSITITDYYHNIIGVTVHANSRPRNVRLFISKLHAPYVETKPFHHSQEVVERSEKGITINLKVQLNFELEKEILGFGDGIIVLAPAALRDSIHKKHINSINHYS